MLTTMNKPWGSELVFASTPDYVGKIISLHKDEAFSLQRCPKKWKTIYVLTGELIVTRRDPNSVVHVHEGMVVQIEPDHIHQVSAKTFARFIEVSSFTMESPVRLEDKYGREVGSSTEEVSEMPLPKPAKPKKKIKSTPSQE